MDCVLRHEALVASSNESGDGVDGTSRGNTTNNNNNNNRLIGREELYRSVEDLCVHKFGNKLYLDVVEIMNGAAGEVVRRLANGGGAAAAAVLGENSRCSSAEENAMGYESVVMDRSNGAVGYNASKLIMALNLENGGVLDTTDLTISSSSTSININEEPSNQQRYALLKQMHTICRLSYAEEYLTFVRSIFLALDRAFVFVADEDLEGMVGDANDEDAMEIDATQQQKWKTSPPKGKVVERSSLSVSASNTRIWGLWDIGIACLRKHMMRSPQLTVSDGDSKTTILPVLVAMVLTTTYAILSEYDGNDDQQNAIMVDVRPLVRNCVRTCIDLGALSSLFEEVIVVASVRFEKEGKSWGRALNDSKKSAPEFLRHAENRLKQSSALTSYYLPSSVGAVAALRQLSNRRRPLMGAVPSSSSTSSQGVVWKSANNSTRRILPTIIETQLLAPHLVPSGVLHPRHLYLMLDDDDGSNTSGAGWKTHHNAGEKTFANAKRLYGLCWRMTAASLPTNAMHSRTASSPSTNSSALDFLRVAFGEYGRLRGAEIVKQSLSSGADASVSNIKEMEKKVIPDLLAFKSHLNSLHVIAFRSDELFGATVRSILEDVLNGSTTNNDGDGGRRIAELLAKYVDARFKDAKAQATSSVLAACPSASATTAIDPSEAFQNEVMALFRHVNSKDVFEAFYKRNLAKRLLTGRSVSSDMERSFLSKLKAECGSGYTSKMEGMFKDMELSRDIMSSYSAYSSGATSAQAQPMPVPHLGSGKATEMDVQVLTTGYWPVYPKYPGILLPPEIVAHQAKFESYYKNKYQGRRIAWQYSLGNCIVKANFPKQPAGKELLVNLCQTLVLLCFQYEDGPDGKGLTIGDIVKKTGIDDRDEVERVLQSLSLGRDGTRVLIKVDHDSPDAIPPASTSGDDSPTKKKKIRRNVGPHDRFLFNASFVSNQRRIRITNITMKETSEERKETHEAVSKDRLYIIDATVVRIMKARKTIDHRLLMGEVMTQLKFPASAADVKKRVESLIEREYMERVEGDRSRYNYLA